MLCLSAFVSLSPYLSFLPTLSFSLQVSISLTCARTHTHLLFFLAFLLSYPLKGHCLSFDSFIHMPKYFKGVQVQDHISTGWEASIVVLCLPCARLTCLPAIIKGQVLLNWDIWQTGRFRLCIGYHIKEYTSQNQRLYPDEKTREREKTATWEWHHVSGCGIACSGMTLLAEMT